MRVSQDRLLHLLRLRGQRAGMATDRVGKFRCHVIAEQRKLAGQDIAALSHLPLNDLATLLATAAAGAAGRQPWPEEKRLAARRIVDNFVERVSTLQHLGLG